MNEQDIRTIWKGASHEDLVKLDLSLLMMEMKSKIKSIEKRIKNRDTVEITASVLGMGLFGYLGFEIPFPMTKIACGIAIIWFGYVIYRLKSAQKNMEPDHTLPYVDKLKAQKEFMQVQAKMLNNVLYWYVLPPFIMNILFLYGLVNPADYNWDPGFLSGLPYDTSGKLICIVGIALFNIYVVWLNRRAVKKDINPVIVQIESLEAQLVQD
ncbi:MAG: hypothetical protein RIC35_12795 [Marinoscillum sp.]